MTKQTPLHALHLESSAKMIDFHGWQMPIHYGSQIKEHEVVRNDCGIFDVSHMTILDLKGDRTKEFLMKLLANDVQKLKNNYDYLYSAMLNEEGFVIDDLMAYKMGFGYRLIVNCARRDYDIGWIKHNLKEWDISMSEKSDLCILAIQGPNTPEVLSRTDHKFLSEIITKKSPSGDFKDQILATNTGYTGEKGLELVVPSEIGIILWKELLDLGAKPAGLGARDTLRIEAGLNLYGNDMDDSISPLECNMSWTVDLKDEQRNFIGKIPYCNLRNEDKHLIQVGLIFEERAIVRRNQKVTIGGDENLEGIVTSGSYSPTLKKSIALARIPVTEEDYCFAEVRGETIRAKITRPKFINL